MSLFIVLSYLPYALVTAFTPGPNNILSLYAISQNGWRKGKTVLFGITGGFLAVMILCALFCYELDKYLPTLSGILKYVGAVYIFWLAIHVARSKPEKEESQQASFWKGLFLQFVNVKIYLYAITIYTGYVLPAGGTLTSLLLHAVSLTLIGMAGFFTWGAAGGFLQTFLARHYRPFNYLMAAILILCALSLL